MFTRIPLVLIILLRFSEAFVPSQKQPQPSRSRLNFFFPNKNQPEEPAKQVPVEEEPDLVEKIFTVFFGKPEESPLGLKRFDENRFPEQVCVGVALVQSPFFLFPLNLVVSNSILLPPRTLTSNLSKRTTRKWPIYVPYSERPTWRSEDCVSRMMPTGMDGIR
jgi:hypothetical protein